MPNHTEPFWGYPPCQVLCCPLRVRDLWKGSLRTPSAGRRGWWVWLLPTQFCADYYLMWCDCRMNIIPMNMDDYYLIMGDYIYMCVIIFIIYIWHIIIQWLCLFFPCSQLFYSEMHLSTFSGCVRKVVQMLLLTCSGQHRNDSRHLRTTWHAAAVPPIARERPKSPIFTVQSYAVGSLAWASWIGPATGLWSFFFIDLWPEKGASDLTRS